MEIWLKKNKYHMSGNFFTPNIKSYVYNFKILNSYERLCKFNVYQQPRCRLRIRVSHTYFPGNLIQLSLTVLALGPLTSSETTSLELSFPQFF